MMLTKDKPDWIINTLSGALTPDSLAQSKLSANDFSVGKADAYWEKESVKSIFLDENGAENREAFDKFYAQESLRFKDTARADVSNKGTLYEMPTFEETSFGKKEFAKSVEVNPDMYQRDFGFSKMGELSAPKVGWRETANVNTETKGVAMKDGSFTPTKDYEGLSVYAVDKRGVPKLDTKGLPYRREVSGGEELKSFEQIYNSHADDFGFYGLEYGAGQFMGTLVGSPFKFVGQTIDSLAEFGKVFTDAGSETEKNIINLENWGKSQDWGMTEEGMKSFFSVENVANMGFQAGFQILGMFATGGSAALLTGSKAVGSVVGKTFMAAIASGDIGEIAREKGLSKLETGLLLFGYGAALYPLMSLSEYAVKGIGLEDGLLAGKHVVSGIAGMETKVLKGTLNSKVGISNLISNFKLKGVEALDAIGKIKGAGPFLSSAAAESVEETAEEVVKKTFMASYDFYNNLIDEESFVAKGLGTQKGNNFFGEWYSDFDWARDVGKPLLLSAAGGAIGGGFAGGLLKTLSKQAPNTLNRIEDYAIQGKVPELRKLIDKMHRKGMLGTSFTDANEAGAINDNDLAYDAINQTINQVESSFEAAGTLGLFKNISTEIMTSFSEDVTELMDESDIPHKEYMNVTSLTSDIRALVEEKQSIIEGATTEESTTRLNDINKSIADLRSGKSNSKYTEQIVNYLIQKRKKINAEEVLSYGLEMESPDISGQYQLSPRDGVELNSLVEQDRVAIETRNNEFKNELEIEGAKATIDDFDYNLSETRKKELVAEKSERITDMVTQLDVEEEIIPTPFEQGDIDAVFENNPNDIVGANIETPAEAESTPVSEEGIVALKEAYVKYRGNSNTELGSEEDIAGFKAFMDAGQVVVKKEESISTEILKEKLLEGVNRFTDKELKSEITQLSGLREFGATPKEQAIVDEVSSFGKLRNKKHKITPETKNTDGFFATLNKSDGVFKSNADTTIQELLANENEAYAAATNGTVSTYISKDGLRRLKNMIEARIDQVNTIRLADEVLDPKTNKQRYSKQELTDVQKELIGLWRSVDLLSKISKDNESNPDAKRAELDTQEIDKFIKSLNTVGDEIKVIQTIAGKYIEKINTAKGDNNFNEARKQIIAFEDDVYANVSPRDIEGLTNKEDYTYYRSVLEVSGTEFNQSYNQVVNRSTGKAPSLEQLFIIRSVVGNQLATTKFKFKGTELSASIAGYENMSIVEGGGGAGKTAVVSGFSALIVEQLLDTRYSKKIHKKTDTPNSGHGVVLMAPNGNKRKKLINEVEGAFVNYKSKVVGSIGLSSKFNEDRSMKEKGLLDSPDLLKGVSTIVYDEAGLLTLRELTYIAVRLENINSKRSSPLGIIFLGDSLQLSSRQINTTGSPSIAINVFAEISAIAIGRTPRLDFSFRSTNQQLKIAEKYFAKLFSNSTKTGAEFFHNKNGDGVTVYTKNKSAFVAKVKALAAFKGSKVFITDKNINEIDESIRNIKGLEILHPEETMGEEWDYVFFEPASSNIFTESFSNSYDQRVYYTAFTRPKKGIVAFLNEDLGINSKEGEVPSMESPLIAPTKELELEAMKEVIGEQAFQEIPTKEVNYDTAPKTEPSKEDVLTRTAKVQKDVDKEVVTKEEAHQDVLPDVTPADTQELSKVSNEAVKNIPEAFSSYVNTLSKTKNIFIDTSFTGVHDADKKLAKLALGFDKTNPLYNKINYFLTIGKIGNGRFTGINGRNNYNNTKERIGFNYAVFIEADVPGTTNRITLGVLPNKDNVNQSLFDDLDIPDEGFSIKVSRNIISSIDERPRIDSGGGRDIRDAQQTTFMLSETAKANPGMGFGSIQIATKDIKETIIEKGKPKEILKVAAGRAYVNISFKHSTSKEIDDVMRRSRTDPSILSIPLTNEKRQPIDMLDVQSTMTDLMKKDNLISSNRDFNSSDASVQYADVMWNRPYNTSSGTNDIDYTNPGEARKATLINVLFNISRDVKTSKNLQFELNKLLPVILRTKDFENTDSANAESYKARKNLFFRAMLSKEKVKANPTKIRPDIHEVLYDMVSEKLSTKVYPEFVLGERGVNDGEPFAVVPQTKDMDHPSDSNYPASYDNSPLADFARIDFTTGELAFPYATIDRAVVDDVIRNLTENDVESTPAYNINPDRELNIIPEQEAHEKIADTTETEINEYGDTVSDLYEFKERYYPGESHVYMTEAMNYFRRRVFDSIYITAKGVEKTIPVNKALTGLKQGYQNFYNAVNEGGGSYDGSNVSELSEADRKSYHEYVFAQQFEYLLKSKFPFYKMNKEGEYSTVVSHNVQSIIGDAKEDSRLGNNLTEMMKSFLYGIPVINEVSPGVFTSAMKDNKVDSELGAAYMTDGQIVEIIEEVNRPGKRKGVTGRDQLIEALSTSSNLHAKSLYTKLFSPNGYKLDGQDHVSLMELNDLSLLQDLDAIGILLISSEITNIKGVDLSDPTSPVSKLPIGAVRPNQLRSSILSTLAVNGSNNIVESYKKNPKEFTGKVKINGFNYRITEDSENQVLTTALTDMGVSFDDSMLEQYSARGNYSAKETHLKLREMIFKLAAKLKNKNYASDGSSGIWDGGLEEFIVAQGLVLGIPFDNYQIKLNGNKAYRLRYTSPVYQLEQRLSKETDSNAPLSENLLHKEIEVVGFFTKDGIKTEKGSKPYGSLLAEEHMEIDVIWNFFHQIKKSTKTSQVVAVPVLTYADGGSSIIPMIKLNGNIRNKDYNKNLLTKAAKSKNQYYKQLEKSIISSWMKTGLLGKSEPKTINALSKLVNGKFSKSQLEHTNLTNELEYYFPVKNGNAVIKSSLKQDINFFKEVDGEGLNKYLNSHYLEFGKLFEKSQLLGKLKKEIAGTGMTSNEALSKFFITWWAVSSDYRLATLGPAQAYKGGEETDQFIVFVKRAKSQSSPASRQDFRSATWELGVEPRTETDLSDTLLINNSDVEDRSVGVKELISIYTGGALFFNINADGFEVSESLKANGVTLKQAKVAISTLEGKIQDWFQRGVNFLEPATKNSEINSHKSLYDVKIEDGVVIVNDEVISERTLYEGSKLTETVKIAMVHDLKVDLDLPSGERVMGQELFDGATFVTTLTRIFQAASNGGSNGTAIYPVMKNITVAYNKIMSIFIKNADYAITPELLKNGTKTLVNMHNQALSVPFNTTVAYKGKSHNTALKLLQTIVKDDTGKNDISELENSHYIILAKIMVATGNQDSYIHEIAPTTSVKSGANTINDVDGTYVHQDLDIRNRGTQLNLVKDLHDKKGESTVASQMLSSLVINNKSPEILKSVRDALVNLANLTKDEWKIKDLKKFFQEIVNTEEDSINFAKELASGDSERISLSNRQVFPRIVSAITSAISKSGISPKFPGGQFILHPADGILDVYRNDKTGGIKLKSELKKGDGYRKSKLRHTEPRILVGNDYVKLTKTKKYKELRDAPAQLQAWLDSLTTNKKGKVMILPGYTEIIISSAFVKEFGITKGTALNDINEETFAHFGSNAGRVYHDFLKGLKAISTRIPATGKHSTNVSKVIGFIDDSYNSVFVPTGSHAVKGSDLDIDEEHIIKRMVLEGIIPSENDVKYLLEKGYSQLEIDRAISMNTVVDGIEAITSDKGNIVENSISVDGALNILKNIVKKQYDNVKTLSFDSYIDFVEAEDKNHVSQSLVGVLANSLKGYQVMYEYGKTNDVSQNSSLKLAGLDEDFNTVWINFAALINAATDGVKNRILGPLGVNQQNVNIVAYLVATGKSFDEIFNSDPKIGYMAKNKKHLDVLREMSRHDASEELVIPEEIAEDVARGKQFSALSIGILNKELPNSAFDLINYQMTFNKTIKDLVGDEDYDFDLLDYLGKTTATKNKIQAQVNERIDTPFNPLNVINGVPHIKAYMDLFKFTEELFSVNMPAIYTVEKNIAMSQKFVNQNKFKVIENFVYKLSVEQFLVDNNVEHKGFDLTTPQGRQAFLNNTAKTAIPKLRRENRNNKFIDMLSVEKVEGVFNYAASDLLRIRNINQFSDDVKSEISAGFNSLSAGAKQTLFYYSLITNSLSQTKESFAPLFGADVTLEYDNFLDTRLPSLLENKKVAINNLFDNFLKGTNTSLSTFSIPFSLRRDVADEVKTIKTGYGVLYSNGLSLQNKLSLSKSDSNKELVLSNHLFSKVPSRMNLSDKLQLDRIMNNTKVPKDILNASRLLYNRINKTETNKEVSEQQLKCTK